MRGGIHHIDLTVKNAQASKPFYASILGFMGYAIDDEREHFIDFKLKDQPCYIGVLTATSQNADRAPDRYAPGLHHLAWIADSRADVDAMYAHLLMIGATILDAPADYPQYSAGYYAVFFADPDGLKLEYVHKP